MKKLLLLLCLVAFGMSAQTTQTINSQLKLNKVPQGTPTDSILVHGADKLVKRVAKSSLESTPPLNDVMAVGSATFYPMNLGGGLTINESNLNFLKYPFGTTTLRVNDDGNFSFKNSSSSQPSFTVNPDGFSTYKQNSTISAKFNNSALTTDRNYNWPDADGTIGLISQTITNGVTTKSPSEDKVFDELMLKATDVNVVHKTGNEVINSGIKSFANGNLIGLKKNADGFATNVGYGGSFFIGNEGDFFDNFRFESKDNDGGFGNLNFSLNAQNGFKLISIQGSDSLQAYLDNTSFSFGLQKPGAYSVLSSGNTGGVTIGSTGNTATVKTDYLTVDRTLQAPNANGTIAISEQTVNLTGDQVVQGRKEVEDLMIGSETNSVEGHVKFWDVANGDFAEMFYNDSEYYFKTSTNTNTFAIGATSIGIGAIEANKRLTLTTNLLTSDKIQDFTPINGQIPAIRTAAPTSSTAAGVKGEIYVDANYFYYCYATNLWRRTAGSTF